MEPTEQVPVESHSPPAEELVTPGDAASLRTPKEGAEVAPIVETVSNVAERPEHISPQHWDAKKGEPLVDALAKSFSDTKAALDKKREESGVPINPQLYYSVKEDGTLHVPDGLDYLPPIPANDLVMESVAKAAHEANVSKAQMDSIIGAYLTASNTLYKDNTFDPDSVMSGVDKDPVKANHFVNGVNAYIDGLGLPEGQDNALSSLMSSADGVLAIGRMMAAAGHMPIHVGAQEAPSADTNALRERWDELRNDPGRLDTDSQALKEFENIGKKLGYS